MLLGFGWQFSRNARKQLATALAVSVVIWWTLILATTAAALVEEDPDVTAPKAENTVDVQPAPPQDKAKPVSGRRSRSYDAFSIPDPSETLSNPPVTPSPRAVRGETPARNIVEDSPTEASEPLPVVEPMVLNGIQPGKATASELDQAWGEPKQTKTKGHSVYRTYLLPGYKRVEAVLVDDKLTSLIVYLEKLAPPDDVASEWNLSEFRPIAVTDDAGRALGKAYPERGVLFSYVRDRLPAQVVQVVLEPIDAQPFVLRAEASVYCEPRRGLADLDQALTLDPKYARAHWLRAELLSTLGRDAEALQAAEEAVALESNNPDYHLTLGKLAEKSGDFARAIKETRNAIESSDSTVVIKAQGLCQLGDLLASGPSRDHKHAMEQHLAAIQAATPLAGDIRPAVRQTAKQVLLTAHIAVAHDIAWGTWRQKEKIVPQWLDRAAVHLDDLVQNEGADREVRLRAAQRTLSAWAGAPDQFNASEASKTVLDIGRQLISESTDSWRTQRLQWEVGLALCDAMQIAQTRRQFDEAIEFGEEAAKNLQSGGRHRDPTVNGQLALGKLCYRIGAIYAIQKSDHATAVEWYDQAGPLLEQQAKSTPAAELGKLGESLVSMGVSYWEMSQKDEALRITETGAEIMSQAVEKGSLKRAALAVPFGNLASMHKASGHETEAKSFSELATQSEGTSAAQARRTSVLKSR